MDIISFLLGYTSGKNGSNGNVSGIEEIDLALDEINGEIVGENLYYVTFVGADGTELHREPVYEGYDCPDPVAAGKIGTPNKASTRYETYTYSGWSLTEGGKENESALTAIEKNTTLYAAFTATKIYITQGSCGTNVKWAIDPDYAMYISGSGKMTDYTGGIINDSNTPWAAYLDKIVSVDVESGVTSIGNHSFVKCTAVTRISLPDTVTSIGYNAFYRCSSLVDVNIPSGVAFFVDGEFYGCTSLASIELPAKMFAISGYSFKGCTNLTSVVVGTPVGWGLYNRDALVTSYTEEQMADPAQAASILVNDGDTIKSFKRQTS